MEHPNKQSILLEIYKANYPELYNYGFRIARDSDLTRDCIQELFVQFWSNSEFEKISDPKPYLLRSLRNIILDELKKRLNKTIIGDFLPEILLSAEDLIVNRENDVQTNQKVKTAFQALTPRQKEVIYLKFYNGLDYDQIAEVTGISNQSVRNLVSEALATLRKNVIPLLVFITVVS